MGEEGGDEAGGMNVYNRIQMMCCRPTEQEMMTINHNAGTSLRSCKPRIVCKCIVRSAAIWHLPHLSSRGHAAWIAPLFVFTLVSLLSWSYEEPKPSIKRTNLVCRGYVFSQTCTRHIFCPFLLLWAGKKRKELDYLISAEDYKQRIKQPSDCEAITCQFLKIM